MHACRNEILAKNNLGIFFADFRRSGHQLSRFTWASYPMNQSSSQTPLFHFLFIVAEKFTRHSGSIATDKPNKNEKVVRERDHRGPWTS